MGWDLLSLVRYLLKNKIVRPHVIVLEAEADNASLMWEWPKTDLSESRALDHNIGSHCWVDVPPTNYGASPTTLSRVFVD